MRQKLLLILFLFLTSVSSVSAEEIKQFNVKLEVLKNANLNVSETIIYDFGENSQRGIFRDLSQIVTNKDGKRFKLEIKVDGITDEAGQNYQYALSTKGDNLEIKIGDQDVLVTGVKIYQINYTISGALTYFSDHDELYWDATGNDWQVPMEKAQATIILPDGGLINKVVCYTGVKGSTASDCKAVFDKNQALFTTENLQSGEGLTIVVSFPKNVIAEVAAKEDKPSLLSKIIIPIIMLLSFLYYVVLPFWLILHWWRSGRDPKTSPNIPVTFDPPKDQKGKFLRPAEVGTLIDESADNKDLAATIIDLGIKGFLKIRKEKGDNYTFLKLKDFKKDKILKSYEKDLLTGLFDEGKEVKTEDLKTTFYLTAKEIKDNLYKTLTTGGFFVTNPQTTRNKYYALAGLGFFTANFFLAAVAFVFGKNMPSKTVFGVEAKMVALGMKKFLVTQERQLKFQAKNWLFFEKLLPFAIIFDCEKIWAARFKDLNVTPPTWYEGDNFNQFNTLIFVGSLNHSLSSFSSMATPQTSSSGFSSGFSGGSSGGGGGGGGGGSW